jgi:hypothetical protein
LRLPCRRQAETFDLEVAGLRYNVTVGFFPNGAPAEAFSNHKAGNAGGLVTRDAEILTSLLQHGCTAETIPSAISRMATAHRAGCGEVAVRRAAEGV